MRVLFVPYNRYYYRFNFKFGKSAFDRWCNNPTRWFFLPLFLLCVILFAVLAGISCGVFCLFGKLKTANRFWEKVCDKLFESGKAKIAAQKKLENEINFFKKDFKLILYYPEELLPKNKISRMYFRFRLKQVCKRDKFLAIVKLNNDKDIDGAITKFNVFKNRSWLIEDENLRTDYFSSSDGEKIFERWNRRDTIFPT